MLPRLGVYAPELGAYATGLGVYATFVSPRGSFDPKNEDDPKIQYNTKD